MVAEKLILGITKSLQRPNVIMTLLELLSTFWVKRWRKQPLWFVDFYRLLEETDESAINCPEFRVINREGVHWKKEKSQEGQVFFIPNKERCLSGKLFNSQNNNLQWLRGLNRQVYQVLMGTLLPSLVFFQHSVFPPSCNLSSISLC